LEDEGIAAVLLTPENIRTLQRKLYRKAKQDSAFRFYALYDKVYRADVLSHAYYLIRANQGSAGVDGVTFRDIRVKEGEGLDECACLTVKNIGKPCAGKPHARFDEGGLVKVAMARPFRHRQTKGTETDKSSPTVAIASSLLYRMSPSVTMIPFDAIWSRIQARTGERFVQIRGGEFTYIFFRTNFQKPVVHLQIKISI